MKKILTRLWLILFIATLFQAYNVFSVQASINPQPKTTEEISQEKVPIEVFTRDDCQHCADEKNFLLELKLRRDDFTVRFHNLSDKEHEKHFYAITSLEKLPKSTPITLVGNTVIQGFNSADTTGIIIENLINQSIGKNTMNFEEFLAAGGSGKVVSAQGTCDDTEKSCSTEYIPYYVSIPIIGTRIDVKQYSLPTLSILLGFIDGFNPCAMWVLVTFLIVLMEIGDRKKMWQIASIFILAEAVMYYLILNVWYTTWYIFPI